jgi:hypothetical protein
MKLDAYGKRIEVIKEAESWVIYELGEGKRTLSKDIFIPSDYSEPEVIQYLEDMLHEAATPENPAIRRID